MLDTVTRRGWLLFAAMSVLWGIPYLLIKVAVDELSPPTLVFLRTALGALVLLPFAMTSGGLSALRGRWRVVVAFTVLELAGPWLLLADAERHLSSSVSGLLVAAVPLVAALVSRVSGVEDLDRTRLLGLLVGLAGVTVLLGLDLRGDPVSALEMGVVVVGYGSAPVLASRRLSDVPGLALTVASLSMTALLYAPVAAFNLPSQLPSAKVLASVLGLALACTAVAFLVFFALIGEVGPNRALVITFVNPAVAVALGVALLGEHITLGTALGFPLILGGCVLATRHSSGRLPPVAEP
jgi:drug/metabolite transporter (DMT)-like permease